MRRILSFLFITLLSAGLQAQTPLEPLLTDQPPVIDGILDEALWQQAPSVTGLKTYSPDFGASMKESTRFFMAYDRDNLYFAARCLDSQPGLIKTSISSRDNIKADDWICINLDSFNDQQSLYALYINPLGIQMDTRFASGREDAGFDAVWYSAGTVSAEGYCVEVRIPLKSIRFRPGDEVTMGVIVERYISRFSTSGTYPPLDPRQGESFLTQMMPIRFKGLKQDRLMELLPAMTYNYQQVRDEDHMAETANKGKFSLTAKYGISSDLVLDGTYNPDYSQIEADAGQVDVNLRYQLYFTEKRPFFLEGKEHFNLSNTASWPLDPIRQIVYTRTITDPVLGVKLSGKVGPKSTLASLYTEDDLGSQSPEGDRARFGIIRFKQALNKDSHIGALYAGRELDDGFNRLFGLDSQLRLGQAGMLSLQGFLSQYQLGDVKADDGEHVWGVNYLNSSRNLYYNVGFKEVSEGFRADMGYITRTGVRQFFAHVKPNFYPAGDLIQKVEPEVFTGHTLDMPTDLWETYNFAAVQLRFKGNTLWKNKYYYCTEIYGGKRFETGGFHSLVTSQVDKNFYFAVLYQYNRAIYYSADPFQGKKNRWTVSLLYQPSDKLQAQVDYVFNDFYRDSDGSKVYDYSIIRDKLTYQVNRYLFFRGIVEYNSYREQLFTDVLASFTYIPGTVIHLGYGSLFDKNRWADGEYRSASQFQTYKKGLFFKASYLWRL